MSKKYKGKKPPLQRAGMMPVYTPSGATMYVPTGQMQSLQGQTFYGSRPGNIPPGQMPLFTPGQPLPPQSGVNPQNKPIQYKYMPAYNTFSVDRTQGLADIPSFEQLRRFARTYDGIALCERFWLDLVPRLKLDIRLKKVYVDAGAEEKNYQEEISYFKTFFEKPDGKNDQHTWIRKSFREQTQIDELYWYKNRTRGGKMLGLWVVDGSQMKPLLDDWGMLPDPPDFAFQQFPWGIPGMQYRADQMIHYQESPAAESPYGTSRVERIILRVNQALRKQKKDMAYFTEGNQPFSLMEVPESLNWTPDEIDSYEQSWNALIAGNAQQQVRTKFTQPGMRYVPIEQYQLLTDFDIFLFKLTCAIYGVPPSEFGFTESTALSSSGESQEDVLYRRTIEPLAMVYGMLLTNAMQNDFPPEYHGEMFEAVFTGYEEVDDEKEKAETLTTYTGAGILGLTDAAKIANLPIDPDVPPIGRVFMTATGPVFLDDLAKPEMREAQQQATLSGYQLAANSPQSQDGEENEQNPQQQQKKTPQKAANKNAQATPDKAKDKRPTTPDDEGEDIEDEQKPQTHAKSQARSQGDHSRGGLQNAPRAAEGGTEQSGEAGDNPEAKALHTEYRNWRTRAIEDVKVGRQQRVFISSLIPAHDHLLITSRLANCQTVDQVRSVFEWHRSLKAEQALERDASPKEPAALSSGGHPQQNRSTWKLRW